MGNEETDKQIVERPEGALLAVFAADNEKGYGYDIKVFIPKDSNQEIPTHIAALCQMAWFLEHDPAAIKHMAEVYKRRKLRDRRDRLALSSGYREDVSY